MVVAASALTALKNTIRHSVQQYGTAALSTLHASAAARFFMPARNLYHDFSHTHRLHHLLLLRFAAVRTLFPKWLFNLRVKA